MEESLSNLADELRGQAATLDGETGERAWFLRSRILALLQEIRRKEKG